MNKFKEIILILEKDASIFSGSCPYLIELKVLLSQHTYFSVLFVIVPFLLLFPFANHHLTLVIFSLLFRFFLCISLSIVLTSHS